MSGQTTKRTSGRTSFKLTSATPTLDKVVERLDQYGAVLVMTPFERKAMHAAPFPTKGTASLKTITGKIVRFAFENAARYACILQADGEWAS